MKILVTGGLGFIGTNLIKELERRGHESWACDLYNSHRDQYKRCDVREFRQIEKLIDENRFDLVYHTAAEYGRWNGEEYYENMWMTNVIGTKNILRLQERFGFRMVQFSSAEVYGDYDATMREDVMNEIPIKQMNDYAMSKWVNEMQVLNSASMFRTETVRIRLFNVYGPGEHYTPYRGVVPAFIYNAAHEKPYTVYKGHKRTFEYVKDICATLGNLTDTFRPGEVYNLGSEEQYEIKYLSDLVLNLLDKDDRHVTYKDAEPFTTGVKRGDSSKAKRDLRHNCKTSLEQGVRETISWMRETYDSSEKPSLAIPQ